VNSRFEIVSGELHAKLVVGSATMCTRLGRRPPARTAARFHGFGGRRRARAGFETRHRAKRARLVSRAAGASGAWKIRGAKSNMRHHAGPPPTGTSSLNMRSKVMEPPPSGEDGSIGRRVRRPEQVQPARGLVSRLSEGPGIRRRIRGRRWSPRPRWCRCLPRSCKVERRSTWPRRPGWRQGRAS